MNCRSSFVRVLLVSLAAGTAWLGAHRAGACVEETLGPPILCEPLQVEGKSAPLDGWEKVAEGKQDQMPGYVLKALAGEKNTLVRMELLRRAAMGVLSEDSRNSRQALAWRVLGPLAVRALEDTSDRSESLSDLGYFCAALAQGDVDLDWAPGRLNGIDGYAFLARACEAADAKKAPEHAASVQLAAAMAVHPALRNLRSDDCDQARAARDYDKHLARALRIAPKGSDAARNIAAHLAHWGYSEAEILERARAIE